MQRKYARNYQYRPTELLLQNFRNLVLSLHTAPFGDSGMLLMSRNLYVGNWDKMLSYRRETALHGALGLANSGKLELGDNSLRTL